MKNILKQLGGWVINLEKNNFKKTERKITFFYSLIFSFLIILFSLAIYFIFSQNLNFGNFLTKIGLFFNWEKEADEIYE